MSRCYSRKPLGYPPGPPKWRGENEEGRRGREERGCSFSELERKFAQLNGTRCLPLVPLIVVESTTRAESRNKGNTSRAFLHHPPALYPLPKHTVPVPGANSRWNRSLREAAIYFLSLVSIGRALKDVHLLHYLTGGEGLPDRYFTVAFYKWGLHWLRVELYLIDRRFTRRVPWSMFLEASLKNINCGELRGNKWWLIYWIGRRLKVFRMYSRSYCFTLT